MINIQEYLPEICVPVSEDKFAIKYGGTQFGSYRELGDGRSVNYYADDKLLTIKGYGKTPLTQPGLDGKLNHKAAMTELAYCDLLSYQRVPTQVVVANDNTEDNWQLTLNRATVLRIGSFEYAARHSSDLVSKMWHYLMLTQNKVDSKDFFREIVKGYKDLVDQWDSINFVHGCLNTDNMSALPTGIDYSYSGICTYDDMKSKGRAEFDIHGRYSFYNQIHAVLYGLKKYREALVTADILADYSLKDMIVDFNT